MQRGKQWGSGHGDSVGPGAGDLVAGLDWSGLCPYFQTHVNQEGLPHKQVPVSVAEGAGSHQEGQGCPRRGALAEDLELWLSPLPSGQGPETAAGLGAPRGLGGRASLDAEGPGDHG